MTLVSALMPTRGRPTFALEAVKCWRAQTWPWRELIIIDDKEAPSFPGYCYEGAGVRYHVLETRLTVGAKRNVACSRASGDVLIHWDDDDWSAPTRIEDQVLRLFDSGKQVTGYHSIELLMGERRFVYAPPYNDPATEYAVGTSLCYRREFWQRHRFADLSSGEDNAFVAAARKEGALISVDANGLLVATIHDRNTSPRELHRKEYRELACA